MNKPDGTWDNWLPRDLVEGIRTGALLSPDAAAEDVVEWMCTPEAMALPATHRYVSYLKCLHETFCATAEVFDLRSPRDSAGRKEHLRHVGPREMLFIANSLYILESYGVSGCVLECGTSHGFSTCCLSHACARLGRSLYAADSFEGLPPTGLEEKFFEQGDYAASLDEVKATVSHLGRPGSVRYIKGWFAESLKDWSEEIAILWMDVDLYESAQDVLKNVFGKLSRQGMVFTHEFTDFHDKAWPRDAARVPNAIYEAFEREEQAHTSEHIMRYFGAVSFETTLQRGAMRFLPHLIRQMARMDGRWRAYEELRNCKTVRTAFWLKELLKGRQSR